MKNRIFQRHRFVDMAGFHFVYPAIPNRFRAAAWRQVNESSGA
ncbi:Hypothetical protein PAU_03546 [Photorhabdus asymbiotica]|uniref:Uncharacterized protein n=1 Tax=Photorhabdus asymbiotica subsp. asymbiotica (strain ATCC 43949 / 3105-77) TaxID=553480 RepID=C7BKD7_PHOAA|nr:Hypothetical protein PAU_03546 [Photorhabdus asymbiotica]